MRVLALYDIHGNVDALDAVLADPAAAAADAVLVGGDAVPGPFPLETLARLRELARARAPRARQRRAGDRGGAAMRAWTPPASRPDDPLRRTAA